MLQGCHDEILCAEKSCDISELSGERECVGMNEPYTCTESYNGKAYFLHCKSPEK